MQNYNIESLKDFRIPDIIRNEIDDFFNNSINSYVIYLQELSEKVKNTLDKKYLHELSVDLYNKSNALTIEGQKILDKTNNSKLSRLIKDYFRQSLKKWYSQSRIMFRGWKKPKGYPGDFLLLEFIYNDLPISEKIGYLYDLAFQMNELAVGVRYRKNKTKSILKDFIQTYPQDTIDILNMACGSSRELREYFTENKTSKVLNIDLLDFDDEALEYSKNEIIRTASENHLKINTVKKDIIRLVRGSVLNKGDKMYDFIYSIGLSDYFPDKILSLFIKYQYNHLRKGGKMIISHKDVDIYEPIIIDWFCDWNFHSRNFDYVNNLIDSAGLGNFEKEIIKDDSNAIFFINLTKK